MSRGPVFAAVVSCSVLSIILLATVYQPWHYIGHFLKSSTGNLSCATRTTSSASQYAITLDDITITIKTTKRFHENRISVLLRTWLKFALNQTFVITDEEDKKLKSLLPAGHLVVTKCGQTHGVADLCCKTSKEFDTYMERKTGWWCHFDDDVYVNTQTLPRLLNHYKPDDELIYIGRQSRPDGFWTNYRYKKAKVRFLTGAGYCISRALTYCMNSLVGNNNMVHTCYEFGHADDVSIGGVINLALHVPLTESYLFHSVFDQPVPDSHKKDEEELKNQVTYMVGGRYKLFRNYAPAFNTSIDPTRFLSLHCVLYQDDVICPNRN